VGLGELVGLFGGICGDTPTARTDEFVGIVRCGDEKTLRVAERASHDANLVLDHFSSSL